MGLYSIFESNQKLKKLELTIELLKIVLPSLIVFLTAFFVLKKFLTNEEKRRNFELRKSTQKIYAPQRLTAYERLVLFLERIQPSNLVLRTHKSGMSARDLQMALNQAIRSEFDHNMSQQIYVSSSAWTLVKNAKEETIKMVNLAAGQLKGSADGMALSQQIFDNTSKLEYLPTEVALEFLKKEIRKSF